MQWCSTNGVVSAAFVDAGLGTLIAPFVGVALSHGLSWTSHHVFRLLRHRFYGIGPEDLPPKWQYRDINLAEGQGSDVLTAINASILHSASEGSAAVLTDSDTEEKDWSMWLTVGGEATTYTYTPFYYDNSHTLSIYLHDDFGFSQSLDILRHHLRLPRIADEVEIVANTYPHQQISLSHVADLISTVLPQIHLIEFIGVEFASSNLAQRPRSSLLKVILTDVIFTLETLVHVLRLFRPEYLSLSYIYTNTYNGDTPDISFTPQDVNIENLTLGKAVSPPVIISLTRILASDCLKSLEVMLAPYEDMVSATSSLLSTSTRSIRGVKLTLVPLQFIADHSTKKPVPLNLSAYTSLWSVTFSLHLGYSLAFSYIIDVLALAPTQLGYIGVLLEFGLPVAKGGSGRSDSEKAFSVFAEDCTRMETLILSRFMRLKWLSFNLTRGGERSVTLEAVQSVIEDNMVQLRSRNVLKVYNYKATQRGMDSVSSSTAIS